MHYIMKEAWLNTEVLSLYNGWKDRVARLSTVKKKKHREGRESALVRLHLL